MSQNLPHHLPISRISQLLAIGQESYFQRPSEIQSTHQKLPRGNQWPLFPNLRQKRRIEFSATRQNDRMMARENAQIYLRWRLNVTPSESFSRDQFFVAKSRKKDPSKLVWPWGVEKDLYEVNGESAPLRERFHSANWDNIEAPISSAKNVNFKLQGAGYKTWHKIAVRSYKQPLTIKSWGNFKNITYYNWQFLKEIPS